MLRVLLVDDELVVRRGIEAILRNQERVRVLVTSSPDADDARMLMRRSHYDVMITDISMPETDGLTLIKLLRDAGIRTRIIVITGYNRFEYAYQAVKLQVDDYLVKPINKTELIEKLAAIDAEIAETRKRTYEQLRILLRYDVSQHDDFVNKGAFSEFFPCRNSAVLATLADGEDDAAQERLRECFRGYFPFSYVISNDNLLFVLLNFDETVHIGEIKAIAAQCLGIDDSEIFGDVIERGNDAEAFLFCTQRVASLAFLSAAGAPEAVSGFLGDAALSEPVLTRLRREEKWSRQAMESEDDDPAAYMRVAWLYYCRAMWVLYRQVDAQTLSREMRRFAECIPERIETEGELERCLEAMELLSNYHSPEARKDDMAYPQKIQQVLALISRRYTEDITLSELSESVGLNVNYLSALIRRTVGKTFVQILNQTRIEKACEILISDRSKTTEEISRLVGFQTSTYFYRVFKEHTGLTPMEWRKGNAGKPGRRSR